MTFEEFIEDFRDNKMFVKVNNDAEKTDVVQILENSIDVDQPYTKSFDYAYPYVGWIGRHVCGYSSPTRREWSITFQEFLSIYNGDMIVDVDVPSFMELV